MSYHYFRNEDSQQSPSTLLASIVLLLMLLALVLAPTIGFAQNTQNIDGAEDPLPRYLISPSDIAEAISSELEQTGFSDIIEASVYTDDPNTMFGSDKPIEIKLSNLQASRKTGKWSANVMFEHNNAILTALPMKGTFSEMTELPVLSHALATGQQITEKDLTTKRFPIKYQRAGVIREADELIGKAVKRNITKDRPIRGHEVSEPMVVKKDALINLSYANSNLVITTTGQVLADAAVGDVVAVKNINSDKTVRAVIKDGRTASVIPLVQTSALIGGSYETN